MEIEKSRNGDLTGKVEKGSRNFEKSPRKGGTLRSRSGHSLELLKHTN